ncbi:MAG TPA: hypothetical protein VMU87_07070 [Stellaceae bacterium]|nr:hypothetical protein [Stellaceae bacterium]
MPQRLAAALVLLWMAAMTWRVYPLFRDSIRVDGRVVTVRDYRAGTCGRRVGLDAARCLARSSERTRWLLRRERARCVLFVVAPLVGYGLVLMPVRVWRRRRDTA